ncbi:spiro-SPASM protein [uncultured Treponema sp.]|uniref:spiro-SPASM protein n=1 Tax=uncultured Treponema sp. TaxID=162155 RepID=UPI0025FA2759|nr:spiro-SPASM protein [uncultured Treponema sp.]
MKNLVILYGGDLTVHAFEKVFDKKSAFERVLDWAGLFSEKIILFTKKSSQIESELSSVVSSNPKVELVTRDSWTKALFISEISSVLKKHDAQSAIVSYADTPFLNEKLTRDLIEMHEKYAAEYSFADGFPYGLTPELIETGTASILSELALSNLKSEGEKLIDREAIFSVMKGDINSFEIETLIADEDYRLLRFNFETSSKINFLACKNLFEAALAQNTDLREPYALSNLAAKTVSVMQTVPAFYNIQISSRYNHKYCYSLESIGKNPCGKEFMSPEDFKKILSQIADFSENAAISLSAFGEPLLHADFLDFASQVINLNDENHKIQLLIETDGQLVNEELASKISSLASSRNVEVNWIVYLDSVEKSMYASIHNCAESDFDKAILSVQILEKYFEGHVYPQFMRMKTNENQLEAFYRFWNAKENPSHGQLIIQKYNSVCQVLPDLKSADLSPVNRLPCWHLRRDMTILADGSVPFCFQLSFGENAGNILSDGIEKVWGSFQKILESHLSQNYTDNCSICDESYTFNF